MVSPGRCRANSAIDDSRQHVLSFIPSRIGVSGDDRHPSPTTRRLATFAVLVGSLGMAWAASARSGPSGIATGPERPSGIAASRADLLTLTPSGRETATPTDGPRPRTTSSGA